MRQIRLRVAILAITAVLVGCGGSTNGPAGQAELRVLHATPALGALDVQVGGVTVIHGVSYGNASAVVNVPAGQQHVQVRAGGQTLGELDVDFSLQHVNGIVVANGVPQFLDLVTPDTGQVASNRANIRMINVVGPTSQPPTLLSVLVHAPDPQNPDSVMRFGMDSRIASYGTLMYFNPGHFSFTYVPSGGTTVLAEAQFDVAIGETRAVVLERGADGSYRVQVVTEH
jgi:hypothetical protein